MKLKIIFCTIALLFSSSISNAGTERMRCNFNSQCRPGFVCVGGFGAASDSSYLQGCCEPILPLRQVCLFHNLLTGIYGKGITALVIISMGMALIFGKLQWRSLVLVFAGIVCVFGSYQVVRLLTGYNYMYCELIDTDTEPGNCTANYQDGTKYGDIKAF